MTGSGSLERDARGGPDRADAVLVGEILRPHGVRGEVVVEVLSDVPDRFSPGAELILRFRRRREERRRIDRARPHGARLLVLFEGCRDRDDAHGLRGAELLVEVDRVPDPPPGVYYQFQLLGCRCVDREAGELGTVTEILEDGGGLLLRVSAGDRELLIPFVESFLRRIDPRAGEIHLELPRGLVETCASRS